MTTPREPSALNPQLLSETATNPPAVPSESETLLPQAPTGAEPVCPTMPGYEILRELGRGGMGVVYQARHTKLNRLVALKMILAGSHAGAADLARFQTEAEAIARLQHPNIVQVYEVGEHEGKPFFSLEFCAGGSLEKKLNGTPLPPREAAALVETLARAMQAAHEQHVIHRDLKPANVLLAEDGTPKITDFGLAKKLDEAGQTASGAVMGTPSYMAPEQAGGRSEQMGPLVDVYALGAILYECLTGRPPFKGTTAMDTIMQGVADEPVPVRRLQPQVPADVETICLKCLQKEAGRRYESAAALADDLRRFVEGRPIVARPVGRVEQATKWVQRNPVLAALLATVFLAVGTGLGGFLWEWRQTVEALTSTQDALGQARTNLEQAQANLYVSHISLADRELQNRDRDRAKQWLAACPQERRNWEWHYLSRQCRPERLSIHDAAATGSILCLAFSPDGSRLAAGDDSDSVTLWEVASGRPLAQFKVQEPKAKLHLPSAPPYRILPTVVQGSPGRTTAVAFSADGRLVASAQSVSVENDTVRVWDTTSGQERQVLELPWPFGSVDSLSFSPDGQWLAACSLRKFLPPGDPQLFKPGATRVWELTTGKNELTLPGGCTAVAFSPDSGRLVTAALDALNVLSFPAGQPVLTIPDKELGIIGQRFLTFSRDGKKLATAFALWDIHAGKQLRRWKGEPAGVMAATGIRALAFDPNGLPVLADLNRKNDVMISGSRTITYPGQPNETSGVCVALSSDGNLLAKASSSNSGVPPTINVYDTTRTTTPRFIYSNVSEFPGCMALSPDETRLAVAGGDGRLKTATIWTLATWKALELRGHADKVDTVTFSHDGRRVATGCHDDTVKVWDAQTGAVQVTLPSGGQHRPVFSPDDRFLLFAVDDKLQRWDVATGDKVDEKTFVGSFLAMDDSGKRFVTSEVFSGTLEVWDAETCQKLHAPIVGEKFRACVGFAIERRSARESPFLQ